MIDDDGLVMDRDHPVWREGRQRIYRWGDIGVSLIEGSFLPSPLKTAISITRHR